MTATSSISWKLCLGLSSSHTATKYRLGCCWFDSALPWVAFDYQIIKQFALWGLHCWHLFMPKAAWMQTWQLSRGFSLPRQWKEPKCLAPVSVPPIAGTGCHESTVCGHHLSSLHQSWAQLGSTHPDTGLDRLFMKRMCTSQRLRMTIQDSFTSSSHRQG